MAYSFDFKDNVVYGADDINAIRRSILTKGVVEEKADSCLAILSDGVVKISEGQAIFADGSKIEVDADGVEREYVSEQKNYVYFFNNTLAGVCEVIVSTVFPENDYVMLAEIDELGVISDKREFAQLKTADAERYVASFKGTGSTNDSIMSDEVVAEITLPKTGCSLIEFYMEFNSDGWYRIRVFPKENGYIQWQYSNGVFSDGEVLQLYNFGKTRQFKFVVSGNTMTVIKEYISASGTGSHTIKLTGFCMR